MSPPAPPGNSVRRSLLAFLFGLCGVGGAPLLVDGNGSSPLGWLICGATGAAMLRWGWAQVLWVSAGATLAYVLLGHMAHPLGIVLGVVGACAGALTLRMLLDALEFRRDFGRGVDVVQFGAAVMVSMVVPAAVMSLALLKNGGPFTPEIRALMFLRWTLNAAIGALLVIPPVLAFDRSAWAGWRQRPALPGLLLALAMVIAAVALVRPAPFLWMPLLALPLVAASAMLVDLQFTSVLVLLMSISMIVGIGGASAGDSAAAAALSSGQMWSFCTLLSGLMLGLHALRVERSAAEDRLRQARAETRLGVLSAVVREQERIGSDTRRTLGSELEALSRAVGALESRSSDYAPQFAEDLAAMREACARALEASEAVAIGLMPPIENARELRGALQQLAGRVPDAAGIDVTVESAADLSLPPESSRDLYRIAQEALNNVLKHASARHVRITLGRAPREQAELLIEDDGIGMSDAEISGIDGGIGLRTMQHRAEIAGGELRIERRGSNGTRILCRIPIRRPETVCDFNFGPRAVGSHDAVLDAPLPVLVSGRALRPDRDGTAEVTRKVRSAPDR